MAELSEKELAVLAYTLLGEAAGEGRAGMEAVMQTIKNRAESGRYPSNPAQVAIQKDKNGTYQYSAWNTKKKGGNDPDTRFSKSSPQFKEALQVVQRVMAGEVPDVTGGATHYYSGDKKPAWFDAEGPAGATKIGNHTFASRETAADAATRLAKGGQPAVRPVAPISAQAYAATDEQHGETELANRPVQTIKIDALGHPITDNRLPAKAPDGGREVQRLNELRTANAQDRFGEAARTTTTNAASSGKQERVRAPDAVGAAAKTGTPNAASADKQPRTPPYVAVPARNLTIEQIGQEADNARLSGYREIQEAGPSSKGAKPKPTSTDANVSRARQEQEIIRNRAVAAKPTGGVIKTAGTVTSTGTVLPLAGSTQLPPNVKPQVNVPVRPTPVKEFMKPVKVGATTINVRQLTPDPDKRLVTQPLEIKAQFKPTQTKSKGRSAEEGESSIQMPEPTLEQKVAVKRANPLFAWMPGVTGTGNAAEVAQAAAQRRILPPPPTTPIPRPGQTQAQVDANFNPAHLAALVAGQSGYINTSTNAMMPTRDIYGNARHSYADDPNYGADRQSTNPKWW